MAFSETVAKDGSEQSELASEMISDSVDYLKFVAAYRILRDLPLGGTRSSTYKYSDPTSKTVLSVGVIDDRGQLPFRFPFSTFKLSHPITSYGCIVRHKDLSGTVWYLLIRRTDTIEYTELLRGMYKESSLFFLLRNLTLEERERLLKYRNDFDTLWLDLMTNFIDNDVYRHSKSLFEKIGCHLDKLLELVPSRDPDGRSRWLFPKGRLEYRSPGPVTPGNSPYRNRGSIPVPESPWECAKRELDEETNGLPSKWSNYKFLLSDPVEEVFSGTNSKNYASNYFILDVPTMDIPDQFPRRQTSIREVSTGEADEIKWVRSEDLDSYLPPIRLDLIRKLETMVLEPTELNSAWESPVDSSEIDVDER